MELFKKVSVRQVEQADLSFISNSFIESLSKYKESFFKGWNHDEIISYLEYIIYWALNNSNYSVLIACDVNDSNHIVGYIIANPKENEIFYQYTKYILRGSGIQKFLLMPLVLNQDLPIVTNWATKPMLKLAKLNKVIIRQQFVINILKEETK